MALVLMSSHFRSIFLHFKRFLTFFTGICGDPLLAAEGLEEDRLRWTFRLYDTNGDGYISREEYKDGPLFVLLHVDVLGV